MQFFSFASDYNNGIGVRGGISYGVTFKSFIEKDVALEGIVLLREKGFIITGLYEVHKSVFKLNRLNWYYGFGIHVGFWNGNDVKWINDKDDHTVIGIDGIIGLEYTIKEIPFCISLDWKPAVHIFGASHFFADDGGISIRYTF